jgi:hypothetical protein
MEDMLDSIAEFPVSPGPRSRGKMYPFKSVSRAQQIGRNWSCHASASLDAPLGASYKLAAVGNLKQPGVPLIRSPYHTLVHHSLATPRYQSQ